LVALRDQLLANAQVLNGINFVGATVEIGSADQLKKLAHEFKTHLKDYVVVLAANAGGKAQVAISIDETLVNSKGLDASKWIKEKIAPLIRGGGGGQKSLATAGGQDSSQLSAVVDAIKIAVQGT